METEQQSGTATMATASLLRGVNGVANTSTDPQVTAVADGAFQRFEQWKFSQGENQRTLTTRLRVSLDHLLSRFLGARDFAGAAQVLAVLYHRFTLIPARCVQASLEIMRRHPQQHKDELMQFYQTALQHARLDPVMIYKEMLMLHIVSGDYYEAYHLFKQEMQELDVHQDAHLQGTFGMVCYWLLFIESDEIRMKYTRNSAEDADEYEGETDDEDTSGVARGQRTSRRLAVEEAASASELVERRYMYKASIGVHILYQEAVGALRRAISVSPDSAVFVEFYVQLLTMVGDIDRACDVLEHFHRSNPTDPHAARLLAEFLSAHYPNSIESQVDIYTSWLKNDPASNEAVTQLIALSRTGDIAPGVLLLVLAAALDANGSDHHLAVSPSTVTALWIAFEQTLQSCLDEEPCTPDSSATRLAVESVRASRSWWIQSFFSRPTSVAQARSFISKNEAFGEVIVRKAVVGFQLFGDGAASIARALHQLDEEDPMALNPPEVKLFRRHFPFSSTLFDRDSSSTASIACSDEAVSKQPRYPRVSVLSRSVLVKDTKHAARPVIQVSRVDDEAAVVDAELVRALEEAVRVELGDEPKAIHSRRKRSYDSMISGLLTKNSESTLAVPLYVDLLEEWLYKQGDSTEKHLQVQLKSHLREAGAYFPSWLEVGEASQYFQARWLENSVRHGHPGLLLRYETFLVRYMRNRAKTFNYWVNGVPPAIVQDALREMKLHASRSHVHFPDFEEASKWMSIKASSFMRTRRRLLRDYMLGMRFVVFHSGDQHIETKDLVQTAMRIAVQNHHSDLLAVEDLVAQTEMVLVSRYSFVVRDLRKTYRAFFESYVRPGRTYKAEDALGALKRKFPRMHGVTLQQVEAFLWLKKWEAKNPGRLLDVLGDNYLYGPASPDRERYTRRTKAP